MKARRLNVALLFYERVIVGHAFSLTFSRIMRLGGLQTRHTKIYARGLMTENIFHLQNRSFTVLCISGFNG
jgi:hypothetical protein